MSKTSDDRIDAIAAGVRPTGRDGGGGTIDLRVRIPGPGSNHSGEICLIDRDSGKVAESLMLSDWGHVAPVLSRVVATARSTLNQP